VLSSRQPARASVCCSIFTVDPGLEHRAPSRKAIERDRRYVKHCGTGRNSAFRPARARYFQTQLWLMRTAGKRQTGESTSPRHVSPQQCIRAIGCRYAAAVWLFSHAWLRGTSAVCCASRLEATVLTGFAARDANGRGMQSHQECSATRQESQAHHFRRQLTGRACGSG
jgi:hypothetical protein